MSSLGCGGRITAGTTIASLRWSPGDRIKLNVRDGLIVATVDPLGHRDLGQHGVLLLPVEVRRACRLQGGDRILLAALPAQQRMILHPPAILATLTAALHDVAAGGGGR